MKLLELVLITLATVVSRKIFGDETTIISLLVVVLINIPKK